MTCNDIFHITSSYHRKMALIGVKMNLAFSLLFSLILFESSYADDILGCGGFVKSHVTLDFSKIEIGL